MDTSNTGGYSMQQLMKEHFAIQALIKDITLCRESMEQLYTLNEKGRVKINQIREIIEELEIHAKSISDNRMLRELESHRYQLTSTLKFFKEANITSMFAIEEAQRQELLKPSETDEPIVRNRKKVEGGDLLKVSSGVTEQLLTISRQLADTTQRSQETLDSLVSSSTTVHGTQSELENTAGSISQSSKLLKKYGRREFTDKVLTFFAFLFFLAVCLYIVQKRLF